MQALISLVSTPFNIDIKTGLIITLMMNAVLRKAKKLKFVKLMKATFF